jgi:ubiquinone/menaquinone biosynthesis C-methylase UbiE/N-acetylglutamate synthase-like GNAT family acetyltransferase
MGYASQGEQCAGASRGFQIEPAGEQHLSQVYALLTAANLPTEGVTDQYGDQYCVAVDAAGRVVGVAGLETYGSDGLLRSVAVDAGWRGRGVGAALTRDRLAAAGGLGLRATYALTSGAAAYFGRLGFVEIERGEVPEELALAPEFASICPSTATVLRHGPPQSASTRDSAAVTAGAIRSAVRRRYGAAARRVAHGAGEEEAAAAKPATAQPLTAASCCGPAQPRAAAQPFAAASCCGPAQPRAAAQPAAAQPLTAASCCGPAARADRQRDPISSDLYDVAQVEGLPEAALLASLGCGNPTALAELRAGEVVLDLGSGGGIDVLLSARRVGPTGKAYGLDMTPDMVALARQNAEACGAHNAEFLLGEIENIPLPDASVDAIISNCVINLSADKRRVLAEAFRVLRPGGRLAVSDIVVQGQLPEAARRDMALWAGCIAGALEEAEFRRLLAEVGFEEVEVAPTRVYTRAEMDACGADEAALAGFVGRVMSAFVRARRPGQGGGGERAGL